MTAFFDKAVKQFNERINHFPIPELFDQHVCMHNISKVYRGRMQAEKKEEQKCAETKCETHKELWDMRKAKLEPYSCDSELSRKIISGEMAWQLFMAFQFNKDDLHRGAHTGRVSMTNEDDEVVLRGKMSGVSHAGTHHKPLEDCEKCNQGSHLEGQIRGLMKDDKGDPCLVIAQYALDYKCDSARQAAKFEGTIEGVIICECKPS